MTEKKAIQDYYSDPMAHCYGCGRLNDVGLQIKSYWDGEGSYATFKPRAYHTAFPGFVYGGLLASIIDCHGTGTAAAAAYHAEGREMGTYPELRFVTASLQVSYLNPTPIDCVLELRGVVKEMKGKKVIVDVTLTANNEICVRGEVIAIKIPDTMKL
jgi:acyl-CoA thioesterase FadM